LGLDLHTHTNVSDGVLAPRELVRAASRAGLDTIAVTDHDTVEAVVECIDEGRSQNVRVIPGVEISSFVPLEGGERGDVASEKNVHLLAYFDPSQLGRLVEWQAERRRAREERLDRMLARLAELGVALTREEVLGPEPDPRRSIGRPHVARALVARGHVRDQREAFTRFLAQGRPAYVDYPRPGAREACDLVRELRGVAVVAHPGLDDLEGSLETLKECGVQGIEVFHPDHSPETVARLRARAQALGLLATGGSDFHGGQKNEGGALGSVRLGDEHAERFLEALARAARAPADGSRSGADP
jgi:predicted metal-dependent phosphoesterase TrpH